MIENVTAEIAAFFLWLLNITINSTIRLKVLNKETIDRIHKQGKQIIFAFWHGQSFPLFYYYRNKKMCILPITSLRGKILSLFAKKYGFFTVSYPEFGSPGERIQSTQKVLKTIKEGYDLALAVDGPPDPKYHKVNPGVLYFSQKTGYSLIPIGVYMKRKITLFWRWDKYEIPLPFSRVVIAFGEPFEIPAELDVTELKKKTKELEERLLDINNIAAKSI
jgi:lysophospholipid acyltransferase (LPLAT)-like uncharacterized protein